MRISSRTRYAVIAVLHLAGEYRKAPVAARKISELQGISVKFLENILRSLSAAGIVKSVKGKKGGYLVARHPGNISVFDVMSATGGQPDFFSNGREAGLQKRLDIGSVRDVWRMLGETVTGYLKSMSFQDMIEKQKSVYGAIRKLKKEFTALKGESHGR